MIYIVSTLPIADSTLVAKERLPLCQRSLLDTGLLVEPANGLLERFTGPVHLWSTVQLAVLERRFKSLALVCGDQL